MSPGRLKASLRAALAAITLMAACSVLAEQYLSRDEFLERAFTGMEPSMKTLWVNGEMREAARDAVGLAPGALRLRYWCSGERTAWILDEIGKEQPITIGVVVHENRIERVDILEFRESRGYEVRYPFFTEQFVDLELAEDGYLSGHVDGITGATLSVRAVDRVARLALWLDARVDA